MNCLLGTFPKKSQIKLEMPAQTRFLNLHVFGFLGLYCLIEEHFVFEAMVCSSNELYSSGSFFSNLSRTIEIKGRILANLSQALILPLFIKCKFQRSSWQQLRGIKSAILGQRRSRMQYDFQDGSLNISIFTVIPIKSIISAQFVLMNL